jgi:hypothetical protein
MSDYQYLESVVGIKNLSHELEKLDMKLEEARDSFKRMDKLE